MESMRVNYIVELNIPYHVVQCVKHEEDLDVLRLYWQAFSIVKD